MDAFTFVVVIVTISVTLGLVAPVWIMMHYAARMRAKRGLTPDDERLLGELWKSAERLEERIEILETLLHEPLGDRRPPARREETE